MKNKYSIQKIAAILCALILLVSYLGVLSACQTKHTCQSVCKDCGKCLNVNCVEKACVTKCPGHHTCESLCSTCNKCTDIDCLEAVCVNKCPGHHACTSACSQCGKCQNLTCTERVCAYKCSYHKVCQSVCVHCGLCVDFDCEETACEQKCEGHYVCQKPCPICGKCIHITNDMEDVEKCQGHEKCFSPCAKCGACNRYNCKIIHNTAPCSCSYPWVYTHLCQNICEICGLCTNKSCTQEPCSVAQCDGHDAPLELTLANEPVTEWVYTELTPAEEEMILQGLRDPEMGEYYGKIGEKYFHCPIIAALGRVYDYSFEGIYLIGSGGFPLFMYYNGENIEIDKAYESGLLTRDEIVILSHYLIAYRYREQCLANGMEVTEPIKVNVVAHLSPTAILYFIGAQPTADSTKTPRILEVFNLDYTKKSVQCGIEECPLMVFGEYSRKLSPPMVVQSLPQMGTPAYYFFSYTFDVMLFNEYFNLYLENIY